MAKELPKTKRLSPVKRLYNWMMQWADTKQAETALTIFAFTESSFFPIPPDPLLIAMSTINPAKWARYAFIAASASVLGGVLGYFIGVGLFESAGLWVLDTYHLHAEFETVGQKYETGAFLAIFGAAFSPIPYKIFTIAAGVFKVNIFILILASVFGRGGRFFLVSYISQKVGAKYREKIERYIDLLSLAFVVLLVLSFVAVKYLF